MLALLAVVAVENPRSDRATLTRLPDCKANAVLRATVLAAAIPWAIPRAVAAARNAAAAATAVVNTVTSPVIAPIDPLTGPGSALNAPVAVERKLVNTLTRYSIVGAIASPIEVWNASIVLVAAVSAPASP